MPHLQPQNAMDKADIAHQGRLRGKQACQGDRTCVCLKADHEVANAGEKDALEEVVRNLHETLSQRKWKCIVHPCCQEAGVRISLIP